MAVLSRLVSLRGIFDASTSSAPKTSVTNLEDARF
jgi:hypothetical protein